MNTEGFKQTRDTKIKVFIKGRDRALAQSKAVFVKAAGLGVREYRYYSQINLSKDQAR